MKRITNPIERSVEQDQGEQADRSQDVHESEDRSEQFAHLVVRAKIHDPGCHERKQYRYQSYVDRHRSASV
jgi:hypothetical protein